MSGQQVTDSNEQNRVVCISDRSIRILRQKGLFQLFIDGTEQAHSSRVDAAISLLDDAAFVSHVEQAFALSGPTCGQLRAHFPRYAIVYR